MSVGFLRLCSKANSTVIDISVSSRIGAVRSGTNKPSTLESTSAHLTVYVYAGCVLVPKLMSGTTPWFS